ncbi:MAG: chromosome segregation protein SMC [Candidatus Dactylopiibacterium carminicum]|uniref:Chromosome partition protein Smc n=1 Tax=Candidatus Dactylopiibacterium carminicum TaxID=857335 RepID=A0A272EXW9_9RHOO|nr:chromosome segregation protein SMC [Candidatus Dactylopiibacterium carminicum]PAS94951.1 MAG: chromosome segregation protein SMC [Candidatus Dactylopiibacterium carminicum]PAS98086.1 MAG: chromosome segregation protein SMC [Candidatus Dactylopiibacterium carminicum]PAT00561.1 MAG: chromosome segregation protein SMC [Candidatus Dactylopiibacterium carminicum]
MRLSKLKLAGFKSFVDATTILAPGQLVGIVGPNGCGKSNVIDAVRWVLGESRASALRGESMQDVIFNGSTTRKPVSRASVEMIFDNAEGRAAGQWSQYAEISVKRQVDRNGGSDYFINNVAVRRKDVIDLFLGTGLGPRAYAIIEQGMISRVIEARPEEVRAFLEEAAGITRYKERRRETEGRLADARDNLARVEDIRAELTQQIGRLETQAELARRYKELSSQLSQRQVLLWRYKHTAAQGELTRLAETIAQTQTHVEACNQQVVELDTGITLAREAQHVGNEALNAAQGDLYAINTEISRIEAELRNLHDTHARLSQRGQQLLAEETQWRERLGTAEAQHEHWALLGEQAQERLEIALTQVAEAEEGLPEADAAWRDALAAQESARRAVAQVEQQLRVEDTRRQSVERALGALTQRRERLERERAGLHAEDEAVLRTLEAELGELVARAQHDEARLHELQARQAERQAAQQDAQQALQQAGRELTEMRARLDALRGLQASLRDQGDLAGWLAAAGLGGEAPAWQALQVEAGWELAVEAVLRERVSAIGPLAGTLETVLDDPAPATLTLLREGSPGKPGAPPFDAPLLEEHVRCQRADLLPHLRHWLDGVYAVPSLTPWLAGGQLLPAGVTLVTPAGQLLDAGALTLFAPDARTHGAIERQREIELLEQALMPAEARHQAAKDVVDGLLAELRGLQEALAAGRRELQLSQQARHERQLALVKAQQAQARQVERLAQLATEAAEIQSQEGLEQAQLEEIAESAARAEATQETLGMQAEEAAERCAGAEVRLRTAREMLAAAQRGRHDAELAAREGNARQEEARRNAALAQAQLEKLAVERERIEGEQGSLDDQALLTSRQTALDLRQGREATLARRREEQEAQARQLREMEAARTQAEQALTPLREQLGELRLAHQAAELGAQQAAERLGELGAELMALDDSVMAEIRETALSREVSRLTREIAEMGAVNLAALAELESARERKGFLDRQFDDLMSAIGTLEDAIRRIDRDTRSQLQETYNTVNRHFGELFPRLFGGGQAQLVLTGEDLLDAGVQIIAQPPGKKNASIHLLSGGEKALTAIALVFAMFQLNPAPFCMLDEVDAPLDDANTERYCRMVQHMSSVTQFIFISHSKITMEMAQQLVGVTMQEQGVSRVVEVDMDEALRLAQPAAA